MPNAGAPGCVLHHTMSGRFRGCSGMSSLQPKVKSRQILHFDVENPNNQKAALKETMDWRNCSTSTCDSQRSGTPVASMLNTGLFILRNCSISVAGNAVQAPDQILSPKTSQMQSADKPPQAGSPPPPNRPLPPGVRFRFAPTASVRCQPLSNRCVTARCSPQPRFDRQSRLLPLRPRPVDSPSSSRIGLGPGLLCPPPPPAPSEYATSGLIAGRPLCVASGLTCRCFCPWFFLTCGPLGPPKEGGGASVYVFRPKGDNC